MYHSQKVLQAVAVAPLVALFAFYAVVIVLGLGEGSVFVSPDLLLALNTTFLTVSGLIIAVLSIFGYLSEGSLSLLLLGMATAAGGVSASAAGLAATVSVNYNVAIFNLGFLFAGVLQFLSAVLIVAGAFPSPSSRRKPLIVMGYFTVILFVLVMPALVMGGLAPTFFGASGPTAIRQWIIGTGTLLFAASSIFITWQYSQTRSRVLFWYALALAFMALSLFSLAVYKTPNSVFNWTGRVAYYISGFYFLIAVLSARSKVGPIELGTSASWAEAFGSDKQQLETLFSKLLNGFSYHQIVVKNGKPVDYVYLAVNNAFEKMTGLKRENIIGKRVTEILPGIEKDPGDWINIYGKVALTGQPAMFENYASSLDKWYSVSAYSPRKGYFVAIFEDITERKKTEESLKENEHLYHSIFDNSQDGFQLVELMYGEDEKVDDFKFLQVNSAYESQTGLKSSFVVGKTAKQFDPTIERYWLDYYGSVDKTGKASHLQDYNRNTKRWFEVYTFSYAQGKVGSLFTDITERKKMEEQLKTSSAYSRTLIEASLDPLVTISLEGKITDVNVATEKATGYSREELIDSDFSSYFTEPEKAAAGYKLVFTEGLVIDYPLAIKHKSGRVIDVLYNAVVYLNEAGDIQGVFAAARDITELKEAQEHALESERKLKDTERLAAIGATAGMVGHDIRNPLQAITSDIYLARDDLSPLPDSEGKTNALNGLSEIEKNIDYINKIVQDLQDYARPIKVVAKEIRIKTIIDDSLKKNIIPSNIKVKVKLEQASKEVVADPDLLRRVICNLVTNAVQAMPKGGKLTITVCQESDETVLSVQDTGVGIPEEVRPKLFTPLFTTKSKGQGFGLAVVKRIIEMMGGTVTFDSKIGKGTVFTIRLPSKK